jgi:hypothetical protein
MGDYDLNFFSPFVVPVAAIVGWFTYAIIQTLSKARVRELEVRERIAMIERGLVPPPEVDPRGFDHAMSRMERLEQYRGYRHGSGRHRRAGVILVGVGLGLMVMIGFAGGEPGPAIGVGGFIAIIGASLFVSGMFENRVDPPVTSPGSFGAPTSTPPPSPIDSSRRD